MGKAGGIIGLISGIFAVIAALITLVAGGVGAAFQADKAHAIMSLGWYGLAAAFLVIVAGVVAIFKPGVGAFGLLLLSIVGAIVGGTAVAICLILALLGGVLAASGSKDAAGKRTWWQWTGLPLGLVIAISISLQMAHFETENALRTPPPTNEPASPVETIATPSEAAALLGTGGSKTISVSPSPPTIAAGPAPTPAQAERNLNAAQRAIAAELATMQARLPADKHAALKADQEAWGKRVAAGCAPETDGNSNAGSAAAMEYAIETQCTADATLDRAKLIRSTNPQ